jgi:uncharacterized MAPEG superfamily protein
MEMPLPTELVVLGWSVVLLFVHIVLQGQLATRERGTDWNAGPRDADSQPLGKFAGRAERALKNYQETFPAFAALALGLAVADRTGGLGAAGALLWFAARIAYIPLYVFGIPYIRSLVWLASAAGLVMMLIRFL